MAGARRSVRMFPNGDLAFLLAYTGHQGASERQPCVWCTAVSRPSVVNESEQQTLSFFRARAAKPCPYTRQDHVHLGTATPKPCTGLMRLRPLHSGQWFVGCTAYDNERGHRFVLVPPSVNLEMLNSCIEDPDLTDTTANPPASWMYIESR